MVTVPSLVKTENSNPYFFYNTHWFVLQTIPQTDSKIPKYLIYAGFKAHYRVLDWLVEWDINKGVQEDHRLFISNRTFAGLLFEHSHLVNEFLPKCLQMMNEINQALSWNSVVNSLHAELFFADKFKDMIILEQRERKKTNLSQFDRQELKTQGGFSRQVLLKPRSKTDNEHYTFKIRKYHYKTEACRKNADFIKRDVYNKNRFIPAKPLKLEKEDYGQLAEIYGGYEDGARLSEEVLL
eukprot:TRINITY_DN1086_c0_g1_i1.p1 TRINITY_DN1086_c0_g1~~TRINITY_DN1086_c0_g1_i1.p1  ORF type:complete len:239 (+),score=30.02 TRINITY_DN1086_c0_g1_i1:430-1146(+)